MRLSTAVLAVCLFLMPFGIKAQDSLALPPASYLSQAASRLNHIEDRLEAKVQKLLRRVQQQNEKIARKLARVDSSKAADFVAASRRRLEALQQQLQNPGRIRSYLPFLDTLKTSFSFLDQQLQFLKENSQALTKALGQVGSLQSELKGAEALRRFLEERKTDLAQRLKGLPFARELKGLQKQAYYYTAQIQEYKELIKDPSKIERKALELLSKTKTFQDFMQKNSELASLFRLPGSSEPSTVLLQGLQTRATVNALLSERLGRNVDAQALLRQNIQQSQGSEAGGELSSLQSRVSSLRQGSIGAAGEGAPPSFKPNQQKTKSFLKRLELGTNMQTQRGSRYFPITSDLGLSLGYKLNDKSILGIGASYKLGLGRGWNHIAISHQGVGLRSFVDYRMKGSFYLSGGYEQNYLSAFTGIEQLKNYNAWQSSGLLGLFKRYSVSQKMKGDVKLLWDFLSYQQIPRTQPLLFRIGYHLQ